MIPWSEFRRLASAVLGPARSFDPDRSHRMTPEELKLFRFDDAAAHFREHGYVDVFIPTPKRKR